MKTWFSVGFAMLIAPLACAQTRQPAATEAPTVASVEQIARRPADFEGRQIKLEGRLQNVGANYFSRRRIVLIDGAGHQIDVRPWLPLEAPPGARSQPTLATYLDQELEITGTLRKTEDSRIPSGYALEVTEAVKRSSR